MRTTIIYPTDFTVESLAPLKAHFQLQPEQKNELILVHGIHLTDSITDLLFFSKSKFVSELMNETFKTELETLKKELHKQIASIRVELFTGFTQNAFNSFCEALKVDTILTASGFNFSWNKKSSMDVLPFIQRSTFNKINITHHEQNFVSFQDASSKIIAQHI